MRRTLTVLILAVLVGAAGYIFGRERVVRMLAGEASLRLVGSGGSCSSGDFSISSVSFRVVAGEPIVLYGTWSAPGRTRAFSYVILMPPPRAEWFADMTRSSFTGGARLDAAIAEASSAIAVGALRSDVKHRYWIDRRRNAASDETLELFGAPVDLAKGRLFLLDPGASGPPPPRQLALPLGEPAAESPGADAVEETAKRLVASLGKDEAVRAFLGR